MKNSVWSSFTKRQQKGFQSFPFPLSYQQKQEEPRKIHNISKHEIARSRSEKGEVKIYVSVFWHKKKRKPKHLKNQPRTTEIFHSAMYTSQLVVMLSCLFDKLGRSWNVSTLFKWKFDENLIVELREDDSSDTLSSTGKQKAWRKWGNEFGKITRWERKKRRGKSEPSQHHQAVQRGRIALKRYSGTAGMPDVITNK